MASRVEEESNALPPGARYLAGYGPNRYSQFAEEWIIRDFFKDKRDISVHREPVTPAKDATVSLSGGVVAIGEVGIAVRDVGRGSPVGVE